MTAPTGKWRVRRLATGEWEAAGPWKPTHQPRVRVRQVPREYDTWRQAMDYVCDQLCEESMKRSTHQQARRWGQEP